LAIRRVLFQKEETPYNLLYHHYKNVFLLNILKKQVIAFSLQITPAKLLFLLKMIEISINMLPNPPILKLSKIYQIEGLKYIVKSSNIKYIYSVVFFKINYTLKIQVAYEYLILRKKLPSLRFEPGSLIVNAVYSSSSLFEYSSK
jgi:hypothetical protein